MPVSTERTDLGELGDPAAGVTEGAHRNLDVRREESEHTNDPKVAREIALDHLGEMLDYYEKLAKVEKD